MAKWVTAYSGLGSGSGASQRSPGTRIFRPGVAKLIWRGGNPSRASFCAGGEGDDGLNGGKHLDQTSRPAQVPGPQTFPHADLFHEDSAAGSARCPDPGVYHLDDADPDSAPGFGPPSGGRLPHSDFSHEDGWVLSHLDKPGPHADAPHKDDSHEDYGPHSDGYSDNSHSDHDHGDLGGGDDPHMDDAHEDHGDKSHDDETSPQGFELLGPSQPFVTANSGLDS